MTTPSLVKRLEALEATAPDNGLRVVHHQEDLAWSPDEREAERRSFLDRLAPHRGLTVVIRHLLGETLRSHSQS